MPWDVKRHPRASATIAAFTSTSAALANPASAPRGRKRGKSLEARVQALCANRLIRNEADLQRLVSNLLDLFGWQAVHFKAARLADGRWVTPMQGKTAKGFPDNIAIRETRLLVAELKGPNGQIEPEQTVWLDRFRTAGAEVYSWWPNDLDHIVATLR